MPSLEMKARNRKKGRSHLHVSSIPPPSTTSPNPSSPDSLNPTNSTQPSSSSSDERKSPDSISSSSLFDDEQWKRSIRLRQRMGLKDTVWWGYCLLGMTWLMFILGMGGVCGVWEWSLKPIRSTKTRMVRVHDVESAD